MQLQFPILFLPFEIEMQNSGQTDNGACAQRIRASFHFVKFASDDEKQFCLAPVSGLMRCNISCFFPTARQRKVAQIQQRQRMQFVCSEVAND
jgi:hypothetical protein